MSSSKETSAHPILVTGGASGKTGRRVAERLRALGVPVRLGSRAGQPPFEWSDRETWRPVLSGTAAAYISYVPDLGVPSAPDAIASFAEAALTQGTHRLVLLSGRGQVQALRAEQALQESGAEWTVVRCSWFNQNFSENVFLGPVLAGEVALPVDGVPEPFVDAEDVADVAVAALTQAGHAGQVYELTGPRLLTFAKAIGEIGRACGRDIRFVPISIEQFTAGLIEAGAPDELVQLLAHLFTEVMDGRNARLTDGVQRALGREPRDFSQYARDTAATGVWAGELAGHR